jgi:hypothetical protein
MPAFAGACACWAGAADAAHVTAIIAAQAQRLANPGFVMLQMSVLGELEERALAHRRR